MALVNVHLDFICSVSVTAKRAFSGHVRSKLCQIKHAFDQGDVTIKGQNCRNMLMPKKARRMRNHKKKEDDFAY